MSFIGYLNMMIKCKDMESVNKRIQYDIFMDNKIFINAQNSLTIAIDDRRRRFKENLLTMKK